MKIFSPVTPWIFMNDKRCQSYHPEPSQLLIFTIPETQLFTGGVL